MTQKKNDETYLSYVERACQELLDGSISYQEWAEAVINEKMYGEENLRRCFQFFNKFIQRLDQEELKELNDDKRVQTIKRAKDELEKERKKLQTQNQELQQGIREQARAEMFNEKIVDAIKSLPPMPTKMRIGCPFTKVRKDIEQTGLLVVSDIHAGSVYEVHGLYGEIVNKYDMDTMKARMNKLSDLMIKEYEDSITVDYDRLVIAFTGDIFENMLRMTSLTKLKDPVIDTVIETSEFLSQWVNQVASRLGVPVKVIIIGGNHDTCSFLGSRPRFEDENLAKIVQKFMEIRLEGCPEIEIAPYSDTGFETIYGTNILFEHGEDSNLQTTLEYFSNLYNVDIDEIYSGHLHRPESKAVGITEIGDRMIYRVGSICGTDTYAKQVRRAARPSAYFALYDENNGHTWSRNYYL